MINTQERWRQVTERTRSPDTLITLLIVAVLVGMMIRPQDRAVLGYPLAAFLGLFAARCALIASIGEVPGAPRPDRRRTRRRAAPADRRGQVPLFAMAKAAHSIRLSRRRRHRA
jgi:hypothetical protein